MAAKILVATDGSPRSTKAIITAASIAKALNATLVACTATPPYPYYGLGEVLPESEGQYKAAAGVTATERLTEAERVARDVGIPFLGVIKEQQNPHHSILQTARENECELIVMASHGRGEVLSLFLGSETQKVLALSDRPVLVVR